MLREIDGDIVDLINDEEIKNEVLSSKPGQYEIHGSLLALDAKKSKVSSQLSSAVSSLLQVISQPLPNCHGTTIALTKIVRGSEGMADMDYGNITY